MNRFAQLLVVVILSWSCAKTEKKASQEKESATATTSEVATDAKKALTKTSQKKASSNSSKKNVACKNADDHRTLVINSKENGGCVVEYTKFGNTTEVAQADNELDFCHTIYDRILGRLEAANFECQ